MMAFTLRSAGRTSRFSTIEYAELRDDALATQEPAGRSTQLFNLGRQVLMIDLKNNLQRVGGIE